MLLPTLSPIPCTNIKHRNHTLQDLQHLAQQPHLNRVAQSWKRQRKKIENQQQYSEAVEPNGQIASEVALQGV